MSKIKILFFTIALLAIGQNLLGQDKLLKEAQNFNELSTKLNQYWSGNEKVKSPGYKTFKRWEWFMKDRVKLNGELYNTSHVWSDFERLNEQKSSISGEVNRSINQWMPLGPTASPGGYWGLGRINCLAFHPTDPNTLFIGSAGGGIFKTLDGGNSWINLSGNLPSLAVSDIVVNPNNPSTLYVATGDADGNGNYFGGFSFGVLKSIDGGASWVKTGLFFDYISNQFIYKLLMDPNNPNVLYAATTSGLFKTVDGGLAWQRLIDGEFCDVEVSPANSSIIFAVTLGKWNSNAKMYRSGNSGNSFELLYEDSSVLRSNIAVSKDRSNAVWVLTCNWSGGFNYVAYSDNGVLFDVKIDNINYNFLSHAEDASGQVGQGDYDLAFAINPNNAKEYLIGGINTWHILDESTTYNLANYWSDPAVSQAQTVHADKHNIYYHPLNNFIYEVNDGGIYVSKDNGKTWTDLSNGIDVGQIYRMDFSAGILLAGHQDNGTKRLLGNNWSSILGGDGMDNAINRKDKNIQYAGVQNGVIYRTKNNWSDEMEISSYFETIGQKGNWVTPYEVHPLSGNVYAGYYDVFRSNDNGDTWTQLSLGGSRSLDHLSVSPVDENIIFTSIGNELYGTFNGGISWNQLIANTPHNITSIDFKPDNKDIAIITLGGFEDGYKVYLTEDGGDSWSNISYDLLNIPVNSAVLQRGNNGSIYIGNDYGVFQLDMVKKSWNLFSQNLPIVPVTDMVIDESENKLYISTYGRGIWMSEISAPSVLEISLAPTIFDGSGGTALLKINSNQKWIISYSDAYSDYDILNIPEAVKLGEGIKEITLNVSKNNANILRTGTLTVSCDGCSETQSINVTQKGRIIGVTPMSIKFVADPVDSDTLNITYDGPWKAVYVPLNPDLPEYVILDARSINTLNGGSDDTKLKIDSRVNDKYPIQLRGELRFYSNDPNNPSATPFAVVSIIQDPTRFTVFNLYSQNNFQYPDSNIIIPFNGLEGIIYANTNANDYEFIIDPSGFIKDVEESNIGNFIELKVILKNKNESKNGAKLDRYETIYVKYSDQNGKDKLLSIVINQPADSSGYLHVFPSSFTVRQVLENKIRVSSDLKWKITKSSNVNIVGSDEGEGNEDVVFTINPNTTNKDVNSKITITATDNSKSPPLEIERVISIKQPALRESEDEEVIIYPSPSSGIVSAEIKGQQTDNYISVYSANGKIVINKILVHQNANILDLSEQPSGLYAIKVENNEQIKYYKILIIK